MIAIVYPFRDRDLLRVQRSLDSWTHQTNKNFKIYFINYGSQPTLSAELETVLQKYPFVSLIHFSTQFQPWNKSRALNCVIKNLVEDFCFVADIDMIFHSNFMEYLWNLKSQHKVTYFKVGFLNKKETFKSSSFDKYNIHFESNKEATGMSLFPVEALRKVRGFDEFFHFWGAEDTDMHLRLKKAGVDICFFDEKIMMLHQWHSSYRSKETKRISQELRLTNAVRLNHTHLNYNDLTNKTIVNDNDWGTALTLDELIEMKTSCNQKQFFSSQKSVIDHFINVQLKELNTGIYCFIFNEINQNNFIKHQFKLLVSKQVIPYYTLKEINDLLLMAILVRCNYKKYAININEKLNEIQLILKVI